MIPYGMNYNAMIIFPMSFASLLDSPWPHCVFLCHEGFKNTYFVGVRNVEGENQPGHTAPMAMGNFDSNFAK